MIQKIEADLYTEKVKTGKVPNKDKLKEIIEKNIKDNKGKDDSIDENSFTINNREIIINFSEIIGWKE